MDRAADGGAPATPPPHRLLSREVALRAAVVALGGAVGAVVRWWLETTFPTGDGFPWTTLGINLSGSAALALLPALAVVRRRPLLPLLLGTGVLGGYTTLSTFAEETRALAAGGHAAAAAAYVVGSVASCVAGVLLVRLLTRRVGWLSFAAEEGDR